MKPSSSLAERLSLKEDATVGGNVHARAKCCGAACGGVLVRFGREYLLRVIRPQRWSGPRGTAVDAGDAGSREKYDDSEGVLELIRDGLSRVKTGRLSLIRSS